MQLMFFRSLWGMTEASQLAALERIRAGGYDGVEMRAPEAAHERQELRTQLAALGLDLIVQQHTSGDTPAAHARSFELLYRRAAELRPRFVNSHTGKDYYTSAENAAILRRAQELEASWGYRSRMKSTVGGQPFLRLPPKR